ncbi:uncharacterized protein G2W53_041867 [Senna tora]|uniref:Uncharacterized protein n=1 Tax=Senna tora TaxID=362788 RepID=A0A834SFW6_9FABA|nr:uncharacterized protein G2W53_041867 [Senna tora]
MEPQATSLKIFEPLGSYKKSKSNAMGSLNLHMSLICLGFMKKTLPFRPFKER